MTKIPFVVVGDGPQEPTGLGRIHRELGQCLAATQETLGIHLISIGGTTPPVWTQWPHFPLDPRNDDWGAAQVAAYYKDLFQDRPGVIFVIWDPGRLYAYVGIDAPVQLWAYTAIDAVNSRGTLGGPAAEAIRRFDRVLGYTRWANQVLTPIRGKGPWLPHGIHDVSEPARSDWVHATLGKYYRPGVQTLIGCIATNQPRKDLSLFTETLRELRRRGRSVYGWLHTDTLVKAWSVPQLIIDAELEKSITVTLDTYEDGQLRALLAACDLTIAPGLGEGFGYPIVESLAAGTIPIHGDYAGGAELIPKTEWRVPVSGWRVDGVYGLLRPVFRVEDWANATERALRWRDEVGHGIAAAYCRGTITHLQWAHLWGRWQGWVKHGLRGR